MTEEEKKKKNKEGIANIITVIGICLIIVGIIVGFTDAPKNFGMAFFVWVAQHSNLLVII